VIDVELTTLTEVHAEVPIRTVAPAAKPVPVIVTFCRPATSPDVGEIEVTVGAMFAIPIDELLAVPLPIIVTARSWTLYDCPLFNPVTSKGDVVDAGDRVTQVLPPSVEYS
jgi:hypothetical protein